jgi:hypothetical protein
LPARIAVTGLFTVKRQVKRMSQGTVKRQVAGVIAVKHTVKNACAINVMGTRTGTRLVKIQPRGKVNIES